MFPCGILLIFRGELLNFQGGSYQHISSYFGTKKNSTWRSWLYGLRPSTEKQLLRRAVGILESEGVCCEEAEKEDRWTHLHGWTSSNFQVSFLSGSWTWKLGYKMIKFQTYYLNSTQFWDSFVRLCVANFWYLVSCKGLRFSIGLTTFMKWHSPPHLWSPIASPGGDPDQKCSRWDTPENRAGRKQQESRLQQPNPPSEVKFSCEVKFLPFFSGCNFGGNSPWIHQVLNRWGSKAPQNSRLQWGHRFFVGASGGSPNKGHKMIPSRELTYPTMGKGKSSSTCHFGRYVSSPWRVVVVNLKSDLLLLTSSLPPMPFMNLGDEITRVLLVSAW